MTGSWPKLLALAILASACGGSDTTAPTASIAGLYIGVVDGTYAGEPYSQAFGFQLSQNGSSISGAWANEDEEGGTFSGSVSGNNVSFTLRQDGCTGSLSGSGTARNNGNRIDGSFSGTICEVRSTGNFDVERQ